MKKFDYTIKDQLGIHARPAGALAKLASGFKSQITISLNGKNADADRLFAIMGLSIRYGDTITVSAEGDDEETAAAELKKFFSENL